MQAASILLQHQSLAYSSRSTQNSYLQSIMRFCRLYNFNHLPAEPSTLVLFVVYKTIVLRHSVPTTMDCLSAIRRAHMELGFSLPTPSMHFPLREALRGARRFLSRPTQQKLPIFPSLLMSLIGGTEWGSSMRCLYLTLWFTLSRLASLIPTLPGAVFDPRAHLSWGNVHFEPSGVRIILEKMNKIHPLD